jgi:anti-sigma B factor antagonist
VNWQMANHSRLNVAEVGEVTVVHFNDRKILDANAIEELGGELFGLVEIDNRNNLLLDFTGVEFLSSAALNKLIILDKKVKANGGQLKLCSLRHEIAEIFALTRLDKLFDIRKDQTSALEAF